RAVVAGRLGARRSPQAVHRRGRLLLPLLRRGHAARSRGDRRVVGLGVDAVRAVARAVRERGGARRAVPGPLHLRRGEPDACRVGESVRQFMLQLWSTYRFFALYANVNGVTVEPSSAGALGDLDRWVLSRLQATVEVARERLDDYDTTSAGRAVADFVEDLSNWYVRRSRRRFWDGDEGAFFVLWRCLVDVSKMLAPLIPFVTDEIYDNLDGSEPSVHL